MTQNSRLGLAQRLFLINGVLLAAMALLALTVWIMMKQVTEHATEVNQRRVPQMQRIAELELNVTRISLQVRHAILSRTPEELNATLADIGLKKQQLDATLEAFGKDNVTDTGRKVHAELTAMMQGFWVVGGDNVKLIQDGKKPEAFAFLVDKTIPARNALLTPLSAEKKRQAELLAKDLGAVASEASSTRNTVLTVMLLVGGGMFGLAVYLVRVTRQLGGEPEELKQVADAVAAGDLTTRIELRAGDTASIMAALKTMTGNLAHTVQAVRQNAESVATGSAQIATGNADLSSRTEQQAGALQQTASSMEQLGVTVRQNADNARQANQLALGSSKIAEQGGATVHQVVETMKGINESSKKIADIIAVIDGIAFQTNILALNAAVEAARAGEQGRGFAVVAGEVRTLAQRSTVAAREIKELISASVERVDEGTLLVDRAGTTMQEIVTSIQRVTDIVGEISTASAEQREGVSLVGQAVTQMDSVTQQNAALVEQSAAAASSLQLQAKRLVDAVAVFRLG